MRDGALGGWDPKNVTVAVQGFGNVGAWAARLLQEKGCTIVAISDVSGAYYNPDGLDIEGAIAYSAGNNNSLEGYTGGKIISNEELLELDVNLLAPCALEDQITDKNAVMITEHRVRTNENVPGLQLLKVHGVIQLTD